MLGFVHNMTGLAARTYGIDLKVFGYTDRTPLADLPTENPDAINTLYACLGRTSAKPFWPSPSMQAPLFQLGATTDQAPGTASNLLPPLRQGTPSASHVTSQGGTGVGQGH